MPRLDSWLSADVMHALGWALIHSLWQCLGLAALAAILMAFSRRPPFRYLVATAALVAMLAAPVLTFIVLLRPAAPVHALLPPSSGPRFLPAPATANPPGGPSMTLGEAPKAVSHGAAFASDTPKRFLPSRFLPPDFLTPNILPWLVGAWLCGVALFSLRLAGGFLLLEHKRGGQFGAPSPRILEICQDLQRQLGLNRAIRYLECGWLQAPAVIGWIRPIVLLPVFALTGLSEAQLRAVIAHELAHIRRLDSFVNLLQILIETLLFYHPAIWWLNKRIRAERELCCDEIAVSLTGNRLEYAKALTLMADWEKAPALAMAANRGPLSERIFHILGKKPFGGRRVLGLAGSILFLAAALGAANALFAIASPIPALHAKPSLKAAPPSRQAAIDRMVPPILETGAPSANDANGQRMAAPDRKDVTAQAKKLLVPSPDVSRLLAESLVTPTLVASNDAPAQPAPNMSPAAATRTRPNPPTCALPSVVDSVGLKDIPGSDLKTVPVAINGKPKQFLLDIGTHPTEVSQAAVRDLALPDADSSTASIFANGQSSMDITYVQSVALVDVKGSRNAEDLRSRARIASFAIGDATSHNLAFVVAKDPEMGRTKPYDGLMTGDFFRQYDVALDFVQNRLDYLTPTGCTDPDQVAYWPHAAAAAIPMTNADGKIQIEVSIQGQAIPAVIDTSSPRTVMRRDVAELLLGLKADTPDMVPDGDARDGAGLQVYRHTFPQISFPGGVTAYNVPALIRANSMLRTLGRSPILGSRAQFAADPRQRIPSLTLGMDVLHQLHLTIAYGQQKLYVTSAE
ncbi:MAG: M56 family metallopeptidase [Pseudomonadota bacterium]